MNTNNHELTNLEKVEVRWFENKWLKIGTIGRGAILLTVSGISTLLFDVIADLKMRCNLEFFFACFGFLIYCSMRVRFKIEINSLSEKVYEDHKTGILNSRGIEKILKHFWYLANRENSQIVIIFLDIDDMKSINESYGHVNGGDWSIIFVAKMLKKNIREKDFCGRFGGDEFVLILNYQARAEIRESTSIVLNRILLAIENGSKKKGKPFFVSAAIHEVNPKNSMPDELNKASEKMKLIKKNNKDERMKKGQT